MNRTKRLRGPCEHCGASLEYPAEAVGTKAPCPHCGQMTDLLLEVPPLESAISNRLIVMVVITAIILLGGLVGSIYALKRAQSFVKEHKAPAAAASTNSSSSP